MLTVNLVIEVFSGRAHIGLGSLEGDQVLTFFFLLGVDLLTGQPVIELRKSGLNCVSESFIGHAEAD